MSTLLEKQQQFSWMFKDFLIWLFANGYTVTIGEVLRTKKQAADNAAAGIGISNSLHLLKLAVDLNIFKDGEFLQTYDELLTVGEIWESLGGSWGGRFKNQDCDHFSLSYNGVR